MPRDEELTPQRLIRGMIEMKKVTILLAPKYKKISARAQLSQLSFLGYMNEICNFSEGRHTLAQIRRALAHELGPLSLEMVCEMARDLETLGYLTLERRDPRREEKQESGRQVGPTLASSAARRGDRGLDAGHV